MFTTIARLTESNQAGSCRLQLVSSRDVASVPSEVRGTISTSVVLEEDAAWSTIEPTRFTQEFIETWEQVQGAGVYRAQMQAVIPKDRATLLWELMRLRGDRFLVLEHDLNGTMRLMGTKDEPAMVRVTGLTHGRDRRGSDRNQYSLLVQLSRRTPCPFYLADAPAIALPGAGGGGAGAGILELEGLDTEPPFTPIGVIDID